MSNARYLGDGPPERPFKGYREGPTLPWLRARHPDALTYPPVDEAEVSVVRPKAEDRTVLHPAGVRSFDAESAIPERVSNDRANTFRRGFSGVIVTRDHVARAIERGLTALDDVHVVKPYVPPAQRPLTPAQRRRLRGGL